MQMEAERSKIFGLNGFQLKLIAIISMVIDHAGVILFPEYHFLRMIGRLSFPIFCFLLVEGFFHTHDVKKYLMRLAAFAVISEIPYDLAFYDTIWYPEKQNVFLTLFLGLLLMYFMKHEKELFIRVALVIAAMWSAELLHTDYGYLGILLIVLFWGIRERSKWLLLLPTGWNFLWSSHLQYPGIFASVLIGFYNGERGRSMKYFFYAFYPVHLLLLELICVMKLS